jgi:hypothetical protein
VSNYASFDDKFKIVTLFLITFYPKKEKIWTSKKKEAFYKFFFVMTAIFHFVASRNGLLYYHCKYIIMKFLQYSLEGVVSKIQNNNKWYTNVSPLLKWPPL